MYRLHRPVYVLEVPVGVADLVEGLPAEERVVGVEPAGPEVIVKAVAQLVERFLMILAISLHESAQVTRGGLVARAALKREHRRDAG